MNRLEELDKALADFKTRQPGWTRDEARVFAVGCIAASKVTPSMIERVCRAECKLRKSDPDEVIFVVVYDTSSRPFLMWHWHIPAAKVVLGAALGEVCE